MEILTIFWTGNNNKEFGNKNKTNFQFECIFARFGPLFENFDNFWCRFQHFQSQWIHGLNE
jgi:hypothetical protein